jgi:hypothetical protein
MELSGWLRRLGPLIEVLGRYERLAEDAAALRPCAALPEARQEAP